MQALPALTLVAHRGVEGDRYHAHRGTWTGWPDAQVTLFDAEAADEIGVPVLELRRNIITRGVDLDALIGKRFALGDATLEGVRVCTACRYLERQLDRPDIVGALEGRSGLRARIVAGGRVRVGDTVAVIGPARG